MSDGTLMTPPADAAAPVEGAPADGASPAATPAGSEGQETGAPGQAASEGGADSQPGETGADSQPGEGEGQDSVAGAPETYADFVSPEGLTADEELTGEFKTIAKELNLPQEAAQRVYDLGFKIMEKAAAQHTQILAEVRTQWAEDVKKDPEIGGDKLSATLANAQKALKTYGTPALTTLLNESGLGNHPDLVRVFAQVGAAISEDGLVTGGNAPPTKTVAEKFYPSMNN